nr:cytochrome p450 CYP3049B3 [Brachionus angularis]
MYQNFLKITILSVIGTGFAFIGYFTVKLYFKKRKYAHIPGPKPGGILGFYFGNLIEVLQYTKKGVMYPVYLQNCFLKFGPLFKIQLFDRIIIYSIDPKIIENGLLRKNYLKIPKLYRQVAFPYNIRFLGHGLLTETDTNIWKHQRAIFQPAFNKKVLMNYVSYFDSKADRLINRLRNLAYENKYFDLKAELNHTVMEIIADVAFGMNLDCLNDKENDFNKNISIVLLSIQNLFKNPLCQFLPNKKFEKATKFLRQIGKEEILKRINILNDNGYARNDILSIILSSDYNCEKFDMEKMIDDFVTFFIAGIETTTNSLTFCFYELCKNQQVLEKLRNEIDKTIGSKQTLNFEDLEKLEYTGNVFKETLRLWPTVPSLNRLIDKETFIDQYLIPENTEISFSTFCAHRNPKYYSSPSEFIPERFEIDPITKKNSIHAFTYFPFSLGPRNCLGQNFATIEAKTILAKIIQNFEIVLDPKQNLDVIYEVNLTLKDGIFCKLKLRN